MTALLRKLLPFRFAGVILAGVLIVGLFLMWLAGERRDAAGVAVQEERARIERQTRSTEGALRRVVEDIRDAQEQIDDDHAADDGGALDRSLRDGTFLIGPATAN